MTRKKFAILATGIFFAVCTGTDVQAAPPGGAPDSGVELRRQQEQMERLRLEREMQERRGAEESNIEAPQQPTEEVQEERRFVLRAVDFDASEILTPEMREPVVADYLGREVTYGTGAPRAA